MSVVISDSQRAADHNGDHQVPPYKQPSMKPMAEIVSTRKKLIYLEFMRNKNQITLKKANKHNVASPVPANVASGTEMQAQKMGRSTNNKISKGSEANDE